MNAIHGARSLCLIIGLLLVLFSQIALPQAKPERSLPDLPGMSAASYVKVGIPSGADLKGLSDDEKKTLASLIKVNDYPIYVMIVHGDYGFDDFLKVGHPRSYTAKCKGESCSGFSTLTRKSNKLLGRNFNLSIYPILVFYTDSPNGYASVALSPADSIEAYLADPSKKNIMDVLAYPYWTADGMNEYGVAITPFYVEGEEVYDPSKININTHESKRLVLDYAKNVDEAIELFGQYNNSESATTYYQVADALGNSAILEYYDGKVNATRNVERWQAVTNFMLKGAAPDSVLGLCSRYDTVYNALKSSKGMIDRNEGMDILSSVSVWHVPRGNRRYTYTCWSVVYDMTAGDVDVCPGRQYDVKKHFKLEMVNDLEAAKLQMTPLTLPTSGKLKASLMVKNLSPRPSKKTFVRFYLSTTKMLGEDAVLVSRKRLRSIKAGGKTTVRMENSLVGGIGSGTYYLIGIIDEEGKLNDPARQNNTIASLKQITVN
jgi:hypothetical protein